MKAPFQGSMLVIVALLGLYAVDVAAETREVSVARGAAKFLSQRLPEPRPGQGLLVADFRPVDGDWQTGEPFVVELRSTTSGDSRKLDLKVGSASVITLDAGRYCITAIARGSTQLESPCDMPFFDVTADSVDITGRVDFKMSGRRASVKWRAIDGSYIEAPISDGQRQAIASFLDAARERGTQTFFVFSPQGEREVYRLYADGGAEVQRYSLLNSVYIAHFWSMDGKDIVIGPREHPRRTRLTPVGGDWLGVSTIQLGPPVRRIRHTRLHHLAVSTLLECWHWRRCGLRWNDAIVVDPEYDKLRFAAKLQGRIEFEFALLIEGNIAKPRSIRVASSTLARKFKFDVVNTFADTIFALPPDTTADQRFRQAVTFEIRDGELKVQSSALEKLPR